MSTTPNLPEWIMNARVDGYRSVYEYCPDETRLFGTESLYGDWNGRVLLLAQDFACSRVVEDRLADEDPRPYRHEPKLMTNIRLARFAAPILTGGQPYNCGAVYGSAFAFLLRGDGLMRGSLPNKREAMRLGARVLEWTVENMPNLDTIICLGSVAWDTTSLALKTPNERKPFLESGSPAFGQGIHVFAANHPVASILKAKAVIPWENAAGLLAA